MNITFDDLTLGEVETMQAEALGGKTIADSDPLQVAGAALWMISRRNGNAHESFEDFKRHVTMRELKAFSEMMNADPTVPPSTTT